MGIKLLSVLRRVYGLALWCSGITALRYRWNSRKRQIWILGYHQIAEEIFETHMQYLTRYYSLVPLSEAYLMLCGARAFQPNALVLTFDDGHLSFYQDIFPLLKKYHVPASLFVATDFIGTEKFYWFDLVDIVVEQSIGQHIHVGELRLTPSARNLYAVKERIKTYLKTLSEADKQTVIDSLLSQIDYRPDQVPERARVINWQQAREMQASGFVDVGGHTCSHPILTQVPSSVAQREIEASRGILKEQLGADVAFFAYPNGGPQDINAEIVGYVQQAGYLAALSLVEGVCRLGDDLFTLNRISASGGFTYRALAAKLAGLWWS